MKKLNIQICIAFVFSIAVLLSGVSNSTAEGLNGKLTGTYAVSRVGTCINNASEFTATAHYQGLLTFDGDGFGVSEGMALAINHNPGLTPMGPPGVRVVSGSFTYNVENNNYFTIAQNLLINETATVSGIIQEGWIGHGAQTLLITDTDTNVEEISVGGSVVRTRTCGRSGTAVKIQSN